MVATARRGYITGMGNRESGTENDDSGTGNDDSGTGNGERGTGSNGAPDATRRTQSAHVDEISRRTWLKLMGLTGAASVVSGAVDAAGAMAPLVTPNVGDIVSPTPVDLLGGKPAEVLPLTSTSDVFVPPQELLGEWLLADGDAPGAQQAFVRALEMWPGRLRALQGLAAAAAKAGDTAVAGAARAQLPTGNAGGR